MSARVRLMHDRDFEDLEQHVDKLIRKCARLEEENRALRHQQTHLTAERAALIEKSELARSRVESIIGRLKAMEV
jgi:cell division protein ZapB